MTTVDPNLALPHRGEIEALQQAAAAVLAELTLHPQGEDPAERSRVIADLFHGLEALLLALQAPAQALLAFRYIWRLVPSPTSDVGEILPAHLGIHRDSAS